MILDFCRQSLSLVGNVLKAQGAVRLYSFIYLFQLGFMRAFYEFRNYWFEHILLPNNLYSNRVGPQVLTTLITVLPIQELYEHKTTKTVSLRNYTLKQAVIHITQRHLSPRKNYKK